MDSRRGRIADNEHVDTRTREMAADRPRDWTQRQVHSEADPGQGSQQEVEVVGE